MPVSHTGDNLSMWCPDCNAAAPSSARFCSQCGSRLAPAPSSDPAPTFAADASPLEGEKRVVTLLFADMSSSVEYAGPVSRIVGAHNLHWQCWIYDTTCAWCDVVGADVGSDRFDHGGSRLTHSPVVSRVVEVRIG